MKYRIAAPIRFMHQPRSGAPASWIMCFAGQSAISTFRKTAVLQTVSSLLPDTFIAHLPSAHFIQHRLRAFQHTSAISNCVAKSGRIEHINRDRLRHHARGAQARDRPQAAPYPQPHRDLYTSSQWPTASCPTAGTRCWKKTARQHVSRINRTPSRTAGAYMY